MKIKCNECYQDLVVHDYDGVLYIDRCECIMEEMDEAVKFALYEGSEEGYSEGYNDGISDGAE